MLRTALDGVRAALDDLRVLARGIYPGLQGMADWLAALGGALHVRSRPGEGTTLSGELPVSALG